MYKNILITILFILIAGCSKPTPEKTPSWYTNIPQDYKIFYAVGASDTQEKAKKIAIASMRESLTMEVNKLFLDKNNKLQPISKDDLEKILQHNKDVSNRLSLRSVRIVKHKNFNNQELVLISIQREAIFSRVKTISDVKLHRAEEANKRGLNKSAIDRFIALKPIVEVYPILASLAGYKQTLISTYNANDEFRFLKNIKEEYINLKNSINIYVLTDGNSRIFSSSLKNAFKEMGISTKNSTDSKNAVKLLVTSKTEETQNYSFNQSKSLIKLTTFDKEKNKISFRQHTFVGKSRKSQMEAKQQSALHLKYKVKKLGIFEFIGFKKQQ